MGRNTYDVQIFKTPHPPCPAMSKILPPLWPPNVQFQMNPSPSLQIITNQLKGNIILGWLLYVNSSFLKVGFHFSIDSLILSDFPLTFFHLVEANLVPRAILKKLKASFLSSSYREKMRWSQGWAETSLITKYFLRNTFFRLILQSTCFICVTWKHKQTIEQQPHSACEWTKSNENKTKKIKPHVMFTMTILLYHSLYVFIVN